jgi:hypothetical protein
MNDELRKRLKRTQPSTGRRPLEPRLAHRPEVLERLHQLADTLEESAGEGCSDDEAEARVSEQVRQLAQEVLTQWAHEANAQIQAQVPTQHPSALRHGKKDS